MISPRNEWLARLARSRLLDVVAVCVAVFSVARIAVLLPERAAQNDFAHYYLSGDLLRAGANPYKVPLQPLYARHGFVFEETLPTTTDPPSLLILFSVLGTLTPQTAFWVWVFVEAACLGLLLWLLRDRLSARGWLFVCAAALSSRAVCYHFLYSQVQLPVATLLLAAYFSQRNGRDNAACLLVTFAGLLKLFPFLLLPWFVWRSQKKLKSLSLSLAVIVVAIVVTGPARWWHFVCDALPRLAQYAAVCSDCYSLPALVAKMPGWSLAGLGLALISYIICWRGDDPEAEFCLLSVVAVAASLVAWIHYFVLLIFPLAALAVRLKENPTVWRLLRFVLVIAMLEEIHPALTVWGVMVLAFLWGQDLLNRQRARGGCQ